VAPSTQSEGFFSSLARKVGLGGTADATASAQPMPIPAKPKVVEAKPPRPEASIPRAPKASETKQAVARPPLKPSLSDSTAAAPPPAKDTLVAGSQPIVPANSFESRFSAVK
jgi:hypothetical protein